MGWFLLFLAFVLCLNISIPEYEAYSQVEECKTRGYTHISRLKGPVKIKCEVVEDKK